MAALAVASAAALVVASAGAPRGNAAGEPLNIPDRIFPEVGSAAIDVEHYDLNFALRDRARSVRGRTRIAGTAQRELGRIPLDYSGPRIREALLDGAEADLRARKGKLYVSSGATIAAGDQFELEITYEGRPEPLRELGQPIGWIPTKDGNWAANEPIAASSWFPSNDIPSDKATFRFRVSTPQGISAISNGELVSRRRATGRWVHVWRTREPMAPYLATITSGRFRLDSTPIAGTDSVIARDPDIDRRIGKRLHRRTGVASRLFERWFGPYPFSTTGAIIDIAPSGVGYALETQTRPLFGALQARNRSVAVHELAHEWFGNSVTPVAWQEIWLNEGLATWAEWLWRSQRSAGARVSLSESFAEAYEGPVAKRLANPPGAPTSAKELFATTVYVRGALTVEALHRTVGTAAMKQIFKTWTSRYGYGNASTEQFIAVAEEVSGQDLEQFFDEWLYQRGLPEGW